MAASLGLVSALDELALSSEASALELELGDVAAISQQEEAQAREQVCTTHARRVRPHRLRRCS